jgi:hypothetical protein
MYSRDYLRTIQKDNTVNGDSTVFDYLKDINTVVDLGCGIAYTTASLKQIFKDADVYGTNLPDTQQYKFGESLSKEYNFNMVGSVDDIKKPVDFLFASEYFEHIYDPLGHIAEIVESVSPSYLYIANSFNTVSIGHFREYEGGIDQSKISRIFNKTLQSLGYQRVKIKVWNNKPAFWEKV